MAVISNLVIGIEANTDGFTSALEAVDSTVEKLSGAISKSMETAAGSIELVAGKIEETAQRITTAFDRVANGINSIGGALGNITGAVIGTTKAFLGTVTALRLLNGVSKQFPNSFLARAFTKIETLSTRMGFSVKKLAESMATQNGIMGKLGTKLLSVGGGVGNLIGKFSRLTDVVGFVKKNFLSLGGLLKTGLYLGAALAIGKLTASMINFANAFALTRKKLEQMSKTLGVTIEQMRSLTRTADRLGVSGDTVTNSIRSINRQVLAGANGNKMAAASFTALGLSVEKMAVLSADERFLVLTRRINDLGNTAKVQQAVRAIGGEALVAAASYGDFSKAIDKYNLAADRNGIVTFIMSKRMGELIKQQAIAKEKTADLAEAFAAFSAPIASLWNQLSSTILKPLLTNTLKALALVTDGFAVAVSGLIWAMEQGSIILTVAGWLDKFSGSTTTATDNTTKLTEAVAATEKALVKVIPGWESLTAEAAKLKDTQEPLLAILKKIDAIDLTRQAAAVAGRVEEESNLNRLMAEQQGLMSKLILDQAKLEAVTAETNRFREAGFTTLSSVAALEKEIQQIAQSTLGTEGLITQEIAHRQEQINKIRALGGDEADEQIGVIQQRIEQLQASLVKTGPSLAGFVQGIQDSFKTGEDRLGEQITKLNGAFDEGLIDADQLLKLTGNLSKQFQDGLNAPLNSFVKGLQTRFETPLEKLAKEMATLESAFKDTDLGSEEFQKLKEALQKDFDEKNKEKVKEQEAKGPDFAKVFKSGLDIDAFRGANTVGAKQLAAQEKIAKSNEKIAKNTAQPTVATAAP